MNSRLSCKTRNRRKQFNWYLRDVKGISQKNHTFLPHSVYELSGQKSAVEMEGNRGCASPSLVARLEAILTMKGIYSDHSAGLECMAELEECSTVVFGEVHVGYDIFFVGRSNSYSPAADPMCRISTAIFAASGMLQVGFHGGSFVFQSFWRQIMQGIHADTDVD